MTAALSGVPRLGRAACAAIFLGALAVRVAVIAATGFSTVRFADAPSYQLGARALAETGRYPLRTDAYLFRPPGYAFFLAVATLGHPDAIPAAKVATAATGRSAPCSWPRSPPHLPAARHRDLGGRSRAVHPTLVLVSTDLQSEPLFVACCSRRVTSCSPRPTAPPRTSPSSPARGGAGRADALLGARACAAAARATLGPEVSAPRQRPHRILGASRVRPGTGPWTLRNAWFSTSLWSPKTTYALRSQCERRAASGAGPGPRGAAARDRRARGNADRAHPRSSRGRAEFSRSALARADPRRTGRAPRGSRRHRAASRVEGMGVAAPLPRPCFWPRPAVIAVGVYLTAVFLLAGSAWPARRRGCPRSAWSFSPRR